MGDHPDDGLAELRRRAYSRSGTPDDLRRLADLESTPESKPELIADRPLDPPSIDPVGHVGAEASLPPVPPAPPRRRLALLSGAIGLIVGATLATLGLLLPHGDEPAGIPQPTGPTALAVFDREPGERDDPAQLEVTLAHILPGGLEDAELRWLGDVAESEVYVARGDYQGETMICLIAAQAESTGGACTVQPDFVVRGLTLGMGGLELRWGPLGTEIWVADRTG